MDLQGSRYKQSIIGCITNGIESNEVDKLKMFLKRLKRVVKYDKANIFFYSVQTDSYSFYDFIEYKWKKDNLDKYLSHYYKIDDVLPIISCDSPVIFRCTDVFCMRDRSNTEYYREFIRPADMHYGIEGNLLVKKTEGKRDVAGIAIYRDNKDFTINELKIVRSLRPVLYDTLSRYFQNLESQNDINYILPLLNCIKDIGIIVLNKNIEILFKNIYFNNLSDHVENDVTTKIKQLCINLRDVNINANFRVESNCNQFKTNIIKVSLPQEFFLVIIYSLKDFISRDMKLLKGKFNFTDRELDIFKLVLEGFSNDEITKELFIGLSTVKKHLSSIYRKAGIKGKHQIINLF